MSVAFQHLRVVDLSNRLSGAWAARLFGDFGAEVILVESKDGHALRQESPFTNSGESLLHEYVNWNKCSVQLKKANLTELIASADIVITTTVELSDRIKDDISDSTIHLSITPNGLTGPWAEAPGNNLTACARVSWAAISACEGEPPLQLPHNQTGYISGVAGFVSAAAALYRRGATGLGDRCDVSELEVMSTTCAPWAEVGLFVGGNRMAHGPHGRRTKEGPGPLWQCKNGPINLGYFNWRYWTEAFEFLQRPDIANDPEMKPGPKRNRQAVSAVGGILSDILSTRDKWEVFHGLAESHNISGVVQDAKELTENEHLNARQFFVDLKLNGNQVKVPGPFGQLSQTPWQLSKPAPQLGEHNDKFKFDRKVSGNPSSNSQKHRDLPLSGIRVLTFTQAWSGTHATQLLALLGADVVQIESLKRPDVWRGEGTPVPPGVRNPDIEQHPLNTNGLYNSVNLNKRAITLDMSKPEGKDIFWRLLPKFDVFCENFSPHVLDSWGVTYETLQEERSDIIFGSLSGYGQTGPIAEYPANGDTTEPMAGISAMHGYVDGPAQNTGGLIPDPISGYYFAAALLVALNHRQQTGEGQRIDLSMIESVAVQCGDAVLDYTVNGPIRGRSGNSNPTIAPHNVYETSDGQFVAIAAESDLAFLKLAEIVGIDESQFPTMASRKQQEVALDEMISKWARQYNREGVCNELKNTQVTFNPVEDPDEVYGEPNEQFASRGFLQSVDHPESGTHYMPLLPWLYDHSDRGPIKHAPRLGEHSLEIFMEDLGISEAQYENLVKKGITGTVKALK